ncbi:MAG TPA: glycosyltransferase, partial [Accumulibacter sp.]|nr:glycosyltransferase [Accumulibacter sp.]
TYVARNLEPYRGFHMFMRALPKVLAARPRAQALIVGGDEVSYGRPPPAGSSYKSIYLEEVSNALDLERVHFLGKVPYSTFIEVLRLSSAHVYLTYPFVLSWSLLEAMSCACPIIASDTAPVREVISAGDNGLLVDFFAPEALAETIVSVLAEPQQMTGIRQQARRDVQERFDLTTVTLPRMIKLIQDLAISRS